MRLWAFSFAHVAQPASELGLDLVQVSSSFVHAGIMAWQALTISGEHGHLLGSAGLTYRCRRACDLDHSRKATQKAKTEAALVECVPAQDNFTCISIESKS
jgi:hypothetical protein